MALVLQINETYELKRQQLAKKEEFALKVLEMEQEISCGDFDELSL